QRSRRDAGAAARRGPALTVSIPVAGLRRKPRPPLFLLVPAFVVGAGMLVPVAYLLARALEADAATLAAVVLRPRNLLLLFNTLALTACVLALTTLIALPLAWLVTRSDLGHKKLHSIMGVLPLAVPGYVMAY